MKTKMNTDEKVMIFIDLRNVIDCSADMTNLDLRLDYEEMADELVGSRTLTAAYMFDGRKRTGDDPCIRFHDALRSLGFRVITRDSLGGSEDLEGDKRTQKEVDVALASKLIEQAFKDNYDTAIVVSGDRDFRPAIETVQNEGKRVEVAGFSYGMSPILRRCCDQFHDLDTMPIVTLSTPYEGSEEEEIPAVNSQEATEDAA